MGIWSKIKNTIDKIRSRKLRGRHIRLARSLGSYSTYWSPGISAPEMLRKLQQEVKDEGWKIVHKPRFGPNIFTRPTTAIGNTVFLGVGFDDLQTVRKVEILDHELNHLRYYSGGLSLSIPAFISVYVADARYRWAVEVAAKAGELATRQFMGGHVNLRSEANALVRFYRLGKIRGVTAETYKFLSTPLK